MIITYICDQLFVICCTNRWTHIQKQPRLLNIKRLSVLSEYWFNVNQVNPRAPHSWVVSMIMNVELASKALNIFFCLVFYTQDKLFTVIIIDITEDFAVATVCVISTTTSSTCLRKHHTWSPPSATICHHVHPYGTVDLGVIHVSCQTQRILYLKGHMLLWLVLVIHPCLYKINS